MELAALSILILNESSNNSEEVISTLRRAGIAANIVRPKDLSDLEAFLLDRHWHLAICDNKHPTLDCADLTAIIERLELFLPWHYLSEQLDTESISQGISYGASDIISCANEEHLVHAIARDANASKLWMNLQKLKRQANEFDQRQSQLLDASSDAVAYVQDGIILSCNDSFAECLTSPRDELIDLPLFDYIESESRDRLKLALKKAASGNIEHVSIKLINQDEMLDTRLVTTYFEGESTIQMSFALAPATSAPVITTSPGNTSEIDIMDALAKLAENDDGLLLIFDIDKTAQLKAKHGPSTSRIILKKALAFMESSLQDLNPWSKPLSDSSLLVYTQNHTLGSIRDRLPLFLNAFEQHLFEYNDRTVQMTCSIGVASLTADISAEQWLDNTHQAMFEARSENDGNAFKLYTSDIRAGVAGNTGMTLDDAISLNRFRMSFQSLVSIKDSDQEYYEAYLRMLDQNDEEISPSLFIDAFTQREFDTKLDRWVILECLKQLAEAQKNNPDTHLIINLTANALNDDKLLPWISVALRTAEVPPQTVVFQFLTEHVECYLLRAIKVFTQLEQLGCETSINRLGENDNSLKLFDKVKPRFTKLAPRFMQALQQDNNPELLKQMLNDIEAKGVASIVGFVESANSMAMLWQTNASLIQGYYIASPISSLNNDMAEF